MYLNEKKKKKRKKKRMIVKGVNQQSVTFVGSGWPVNQTTTVMDKKKKQKKRFCS